eukprot:scaffold325593_cov57-Tisochrysis_lutea.AAC.4
MADGRSVARLFPLAPLAWHGTASSARSSASATDRPQRSQEESADSRQISTGQPASGEKELAHEWQRWNSSSRGAGRQGARTREGAGAGGRRTTRGYK